MTRLPRKLLCEMALDNNGERMEGSPRPESQDESPQGTKRESADGNCEANLDSSSGDYWVALGGHRTQAALWPHTGPEVISKPTSSLTSVFSSQAT